MFQLSGTECRSSAISLMQDYSTLQVHRLDCFTKCLANVARRWQRRPVKRDTKHMWSSTAHAPVDSAEGSAML
jgi:hypothetical protein